MRIIIWVVSIMVLAVFPVHAATIHGTVYDLGLQKIDKAVVRIDTRPEQSMVTEDGHYSFYAPSGNYQVTAMVVSGEYIILSGVASVDIDSEGEFIVDLILIPDLQEGIWLVEESRWDPELVDESQTSPNFFLIALVSFLTGAAVFWVIWRMKKPSHKEKEERDDESLAIRLLQENEGRMNQRDLVRLTGYSKAKLSLILADLEDQKRIRKVKQGRGNIIILER